MEAHAQSGWLCELVVESADARVRECEFVELLVDTGSTEHVCVPHDFTHAALNFGPRVALKTATGELLRHYGTRAVDLPVSRRRTSSGLHSCRCEATISECLKVDGQRHRNIHPSWQADLLVRRLNSHVVVVFFVLQCQAVVPMLLALVDEEPAGEAPDLPPIDEEMERELMGREEVEPPAAIEVPAPR